MPAVGGSGDSPATDPLSSTIDEDRPQAAIRKAHQRFFHQPQKGKPLNSAISPSQRLLSLVVPKMEAMGYRYRKTGNLFSKTNGETIDQFSLSFDGRGGLVSVDGAFAVILPKVEALLAKAFGANHPWSAGASFGNAGIKPHLYDLFVMEYAALTPKQKAAVDPDLIHPQVRIEGGLAYVLDVHEQHACKLFQKVSTPRELYDLMLDAMRGDIWSRQMSHFLPTAMRNSLVLGAALGLDTQEIYRFAEEYAVRHNAQIARDAVNNADVFLSTAETIDLRM
jgi:hypothetical protein